MPKGTSELVDEALMEISKAQRELRLMMKMNDLMVVQRSSSGLEALWNAEKALRKVPVMYKRERALEGNESR